jgi:hypothetical protein
MLVNGGFEKYIKYICSLVCICLMISPFREMDLTKITELSVVTSDTESPENGLYAASSQIAESRAEEYINEIVFSEIGIKPHSTDIKIDWTLREPIIESITVSLASEDIGKSDATKNYLSNLLGGEVNVVAE